MMIDNVTPSQMKKINALTERHISPISNINEILNFDISNINIKRDIENKKILLHSIIYYNDNFDYEIVCAYSNNKQIKGIALENINYLKLPDIIQIGLFTRMIEYILKDKNIKNKQLFCELGSKELKKMYLSVYRIFRPMQIMESTKHFKGKVMVEMH